MPGWRVTVGGVLAAGAVFALVGENGKFDCRRMYIHVPLQAYLSPVDTRCSMGGAMPVEGAPGQINCQLRYTGPETGGGIVPVYLRSMPEAEDFPWKADPVRYGDWVTGTATLGDSPIFLAILESAEHGDLVLVSDMGDWESGPFANLGDRSPDAVRTVIDGLEQEAAVPVPEEAGIAVGTSLFATDGRFDCSKVFRRLSLATGATAYIGLPVTSATNPVVRETGDHRSCALATGVPEEETSIFPGPTGNLSAELTTGPKDAVRGTPFTGSPDLVGWEEYWNFDGAGDPVDATFEGRQSYNARYCRSDSDCITVTAYTGSGEEGGGSPQARKVAALPLVRLVAEREGLLTDGAQQ